MFQRKLRKLIRHPKLFFSDMVIKRRRSIDSLKPKKIEGHCKYTIVSAVYNVERYLNEYIESVIKQHLDFKNNIHLILVDDGSTDDSAVIIKKWQHKYPDNIQYFYKENGGQASARNLGMKYVKTEWVTFADPDDILDFDYFYQVDIFARKQKNNDIKLLCNNFIFYFEDQDVYKDTHPLKYRFTKGDVIYPVNDLGKNMQLAVNSAIFKSDFILNNKILFDDRVKPNFEDAHFIGCYLSGIDDGHVGFVSKARYYYRKRSDGSSTLDTAWEKKGLYDDVLVYGCIDMFNQYLSKHGNVPKHVQRTVLYHLIWYFKRLVNNKQKLAFISDNEIETFKVLLNRIFSNIDVDTIMEFELAGCWFYHKVALMGLFKEVDPHFQIAYIEALDQTKGMVELRYFTRKVGFEAICIAGEDVIPCFAKNVGHEFLGDSFVIERRLWFPISTGQQESNSILKVTIGNTTARISLAGKQHHNGVTYKQIESHFISQKPKYKVDKKYQHAWLLMDRNTQADDNAEHLYRYIKKNHSEQEIYFVLEPSSNDWPRLAAEGFNLLAFGSDEHESALRSCTKLISSHIDKYVSNYLGPKMLAGRHLIFLQHGVTKDNLSGWLNSKEAINCLVTTTPDEYHSIVDDGSPYKFSRKDVVLTGFPRHDALLHRQHKTERLVVIMPTWRKTLVGDATQNGNDRQLTPEFMQSEFSQHWFGLLHSEGLQTLSQQYNFKIAFYPHALLEPCLAHIELPKYIEVVDKSTVPIQTVFSRAAMIITDYSSVAFDMAVLDKPCIYYQFDESSFFNGEHSYTKGYFDYRQHGFGPVVTDQQALFIELETMLENDGRPNQEILSRITQTFPLRDGKSCERVYQAICALDMPHDLAVINPTIAQQYAEHATAQRAWSLAESRWQLVQKHGDATQRQQAWLSRIEALRESGRQGEAQALLDSMPMMEQDSAIRLERVRLLAARHKWQEAAICWQQQPPSTLADQFCYLHCLAEMEQLDALELTLRQPWVEVLSIQQQQLAQAWVDVARRDYEAAASRLESIIAEFDISELAILKPQLLLSRCLRERGLLEAAQEQLQSYLLHTQQDPQWRLEKALLAASQTQWNEVVEQLEQIYPVVTDMPTILVAVYLNALRHQHLLERAGAVLATLPKSTLKISAVCSAVCELQQAIGRMLLDKKRWVEAAEIWASLLDDSRDAHFYLAFAYRMSGQVEKGMALLQQPKCREPESMQEWQLIAELAQLTGQWQLAAHCWASLLRFYPELAPVDCWDKLNTTQMLFALQNMRNEAT